jgi:hypothetical protein
MKQVVINNFGASKTIYLLDKTEEKMYSFLQLKQGWGFGMGDSIKLSTFNKSLEVYRFGCKMGFRAETSPILNGGINIFFFLKNNDISLQASISPSLEMDIEIQKGFGQDYEILLEKENANYYDIRKSLNEIRGICYTSEYSPSIFTTTTTKDFPVIALSIPQIMEEFPLYNSPVQSTQPPVEYVSTLQNSIQR